MSVGPDSGDEDGSPADSPDGYSGDETTRRITQDGLKKGVLVLGLPLAIAMALQGTFNLVDMFIIGKLPNGTEALGALVICDLVAMVPTIIANGISNSSAAIISRRAGEGDSRGLSRTTWQSLVMVGLMSAVFGVIGVTFAEELTGDVFAAKGQVKLLATEYMAIIVGGSFTILLLLQVCAIMRALGDGRTPLVLLLGSNVVNLFLSIIMVFGNGPAPEIFAWATDIADAVGIEPMGVAGAAWSTVISRAAALVIGALKLARHHGMLKFYLRDLWPVREEFKRIWKIAWPNSAQFVLRIGVILFFMRIITDLFTTETDPTTLTAFGICMRLDTLVLFASMGWGAAASTYVGTNLGAGKRRRALASGWVAAGFNGLFMLLVLGFYLAFAEPIIMIFDDTPAVVEIGKEYLYIVGGTYVFLGIAVVLSQALSGAGATMSSFFIDAVVLIGILVPVTLIILATSDMSRVDTWSLIAAGNVVSCIAYTFWYKKGRWATKEI